MLIQFSVENVLSFDEETVFSMAATGADARHPAHLIPDAPRKGDAVLRAAALYGANAAGKSNLILAMQSAQDLVLNGTRGGQALPVRPFKLGADPKRPGKFEFIVKTGGVVYDYGFRLDGVKILEEWLFATAKTREALHFRRVTTPGGKTQVEFGPSFAGRAKREGQFLEFVAQGTRPNQLFLTECRERNVPQVAPVVQWFANDLLIVEPEARFQHIENQVHLYSDFGSFLAGFLHSAGTGIVGLTTEEAPFDFERDTPDLPEWQRQRIREGIAREEPDTVTVIEGDNGQHFPLARGKDGGPVLVQIKMNHQTKSGASVAFEMEEESDGTQRLMHLLPALFSLAQNPEQVLVIDELDRRMHPLLSRLLVRTALGQGGQGQLIFTTYDTNLLDLDLLRRDEIWFVEKDGGGASHLYSLAEFKARPDLKIEKGYLMGRFGAIPFIGDTPGLFRDDSAGRPPSQ